MAQTWREEMQEQLAAEMKVRVAAETALDGDSLTSLDPAPRAALMRRFLASLWENGLLDQDGDYFNEMLRNVAEAMHVPYVELFLAYNAVMDQTDVTREEMVEWLEWCRQHAPERLSARKEAEK